MLCSCSLIGIIVIVFVDSRPHVQVLKTFCSDRNSVKSVLQVMTYCRVRKEVVSVAVADARLSDVVSLHSFRSKLARWLQSPPYQKSKLWPPADAAVRLMYAHCICVFRLSVICDYTLSAILQMMCYITNSAILQMMLEHLIAVLSWVEIKAMCLQRS